MRRKNFFIAICCGFVVGVVMVCSANAETIIAQSGFNNASGIADPAPLTTGALDGQGGTGLGWMNPWTLYTGSAPTTVQTATIKEGDQAVKTLGIGGSYGRVFTEQTSLKVLVEYSVNVGNQGTSSTSFYVSDVKPGEAFAPGNLLTVAAFQLHKSRSIDVNDGGAWKTSTWGAGTIQEDTWYTIGLLCDLDTDTYTVSLDGTYDSTTYNFASAGANADATVWYGGIPELYIDQVIITAIPEPSTFALLCLGMIGAMVSRGRRMS